jgi:hypothetical protein
MFKNTDIIFSYTAEQAVEDGILVDVSEMAKEVGFALPVRITQGVHQLCTPPKSNRVASYSGRLWDVLWMAMRIMFLMQSRDDGFVEFRVRIGKKNERLWATMDGTSGPAVHIMRPEEH